MRIQLHCGTQGIQTAGPGTDFGKERTFEKKRSCYIREEDVAGITIKRKMFATDQKERYFHLYYSVSRESREHNDLDENLKKMADAMKRQEGREYQFSERYELPV